MSDGACIIACNSGDLDYVGLAAINARLVRQHLRLPVCLLTTDMDDHPGFDVTVRIPQKPSHTRSVLKGSEIFSYSWKNDHRIEAFEHTPWSRTLLIDADYLVMSDLLAPLIGSDSDFMIMDHVYDVTGRNSFKHMDLLPNKSLRQAWATVMVFDSRAADVFHAANMVRQNYGYYAAMFDWPVRPFRNDFAFTVAAHLLNKERVPFSMAQLPADAAVEADSKGLLITYANHVMRWNADLHVLNKQLAIDPSVLDSLLA